MSDLTKTLNGQILRAHLHSARSHALKAAHLADRENDTERHQRIMAVLTAIDDALDLNRPLSEELKKLMEET